MKHRTIKHKTTGEELYAAMVENDAMLLEKAIEDNANLTDADLSHRNLTNVTLDGAQIKDASFDYSNLCGANISEAMLERCTFNHASLIDTCLCETTLTECHFYYTRFGATDICYAAINACHFTGPGTFALNFLEARDLKSCIYETEEQQSHAFSKPPIVISGLLQSPTIIFESSIILGNKTFSSEVFSQLLSGIFYKRNEKIDNRELDMLRNLISKTG